MSKFRQIWLEEEGDLADGIFKKLTENSEEVSVKFRFVEDVEIVVPADSSMARVLKEKLTDDFRGQQVLIYRRTDNDTDPLKIALKRGGGKR